MRLEEKMNSKPYVFFEWLFALVMVNILTILLIIPIITFLPALTATSATIKDFIEHGPRLVFKPYFKNFAKYFVKSFLVGLIILTVIAIAGYGVFFYVKMMEINEVTFLLQAGFVVMILLIVLIIFMLLHLPLLIITFKEFSIWELFRTSIYVAFKYILSTLIMLIALVVMIIGVVAYPIWVLIGIALPIFLVIKLTRGVYYKLEKINLDYEKWLKEELEDEK